MIRETRKPKFSYDDDIYLNLGKLASPLNVTITSDGDNVTAKKIPELDITEETIEVNLFKFLTLKAELSNFYTNVRPSVSPSSHV